MPNWQATDIADLVVATQEERYEDRIVELATDLQEHVAMAQLSKQNKITHQGGTKLKFYLMDTFIDSAEDVGLYNVVTAATGDVLSSGEAPWRWTQVNFALDEREEALNSGDKVKVLDFVKSKRLSMNIARAAHFEKRFWAHPSSSTNTTQPWGIDSHVTYPASFSAAGFVGVNPPGWASGCGVDSDEHARWANWYNQYTAIEQDDFVDKACRLMYKTAFKSPVPNPDIADLIGAPKRAIYTCYDVVEQIRHLQRSQNDNIGSDIAAYFNMAILNGIPMQSVPYLDADNDTKSDMAQYDPAYFIDWSTMEFAFQAGYDEEVKVIPGSNQPHVYITVITDSWNLICKNKRRNGLLTTAIA